VFVGFWLLISRLFAELSGWTLLARRYRHLGPRPTGTRLSGQVVGLGPVRENGATKVLLASEGLHLERNPLFRFGHPPILVPWAAVQYVSAGRFLWRRWHSLQLAGLTTLRVKDRAYEALAPYLPGPHHAPAA
jgi:hypothetical protein